MININNLNSIFFSIIFLVLGVVTSLSLPPFNYVFINFITISIFFLLLQKIVSKNKLRNFFAGYFFGFGYFLASLYWISNSLRFDEIFNFLIPATIIGVPLFLAIFYGLTTLIFSFIKTELSIKDILVFSIIFSLCEFTRGFILTGFPWNLIAYSWSKDIYSIQILSLIGTYSFNLLSITLFLIPALIFSSKSRKFKIITIVFIFFILSSNSFYGKNRIEKLSQINKKDLSYLIKIVSPRIDIKRFFKTDNTYELINEMSSYIKPGIEKNSIYIFPEGMLPNIYSNELKLFQKEFKNLLKPDDIIIMGINSLEDYTKQENLYNSLVVLDSNLRTIEKYNKQNLVPFGEFLPFEKLITSFGLKKVSIGYKSFSPGLEKKVIFLEKYGIRFLPTICYEIIYTGNFQKQTFNIIINISEDGWFGNSIGNHQHFAHSIFRSIEQGSSLLRSANNGISAHITPYGFIENKLESTEKGVIEINSLYPKVKTLFNETGNKVFFYLIFFYISLIFFIKLYKK